MPRKYDIGDVIEFDVPGSGDGLHHTGWAKGARAEVVGLGRRKKFFIRFFNSCKNIMELDEKEAAQYNWYHKLRGAKIVE